MRPFGLSVRDVDEDTEAFKCLHNDLTAWSFRERLYGHNDPKLKLDHSRRLSFESTERRSEYTTGFDMFPWHEEKIPILITFSEDIGPGWFIFSSSGSLLVTRERTFFSRSKFKITLSRDVDSVWKALRPSCDQVRLEYRETFSKDFSTRKDLAELKRIRVAIPGEKDYSNVRNYISSFYSSERWNLYVHSSLIMDVIVSPIPETKSSDAVLNEAWKSLEKLLIGTPIDDYHSFKERESVFARDCNLQEIYSGPRDALLNIGKLESEVKLKVTDEVKLKNMVKECIGIQKRVFDNLELCKKFIDQLDEKLEGMLKSTAQEPGTPAKRQLQKNTKLFQKSDDSLMITYELQRIKKCVGACESLKTAMKSFVEKLTQENDPTVEDLANSFLENLRMLIQPFTNYCGEYDYLMIFVKKVKERWPEVWRDFKAPPSTAAQQSQDWVNLLVEPVQNVCRISLLTKEIVHVMAPTHPSYSLALKAAQTSAEFAAQVNAGREASATVRLIDALNGNTSSGVPVRVPGIKDYLKHETRLLSEYELTDMTYAPNSHTIILMIFTDMVMVITKQSNDEPMPEPAKIADEFEKRRLEKLKAERCYYKYEIQTVFQYDKSRIQLVDIGAHQFAIVGYPHKTKSVIFVSHTEGRKMRHLHLLEGNGTKKASALRALRVALDMALRGKLRPFSMREKQEFENSIAAQAEGLQPDEASQNELKLPEKPLQRNPSLSSGSTLLDTGVVGPQRRNTVQRNDSLSNLKRQNTRSTLRLSTNVKLFGRKINETLEVLAAKVNPDQLEKLPYQSRIGIMMAENVDDLRLAMKTIESQHHHYDILGGVYLQKNGHIRMFFGSKLSPFVDGRDTSEANVYDEIFKTPEAFHIRYKEILAKIQFMYQNTPVAFNPIKHALRECYMLAMPLDRLDCGAVMGKLSFGIFVDNLIRKTAELLIEPKPVQTPSPLNDNTDKQSVKTVKTVPEEKRSEMTGTIKEKWGTIVGDPLTIRGSAFSTMKRQRRNSFSAPPTESLEIESPIKRASAVSYTVRERRSTRAALTIETFAPVAGAAATKPPLQPIMTTKKLIENGSVRSFAMNANKPPLGRPHFATPIIAQPAGIESDGTLNRRAAALFTGRRGGVENASMINHAAASMFFPVSDRKEDKSSSISTGSMRRSKYGSSGNSAASIKARSVRNVDIGGDFLSRFDMKKKPLGRKAKNGVLDKCKEIFKAFEAIAKSKTPRSLITVEMWSAREKLFIDNTAKVFMRDPDFSNSSCEQISTLNLYCVLWSVAKFEKELKLDKAISTSLRKELAVRAERIFANAVSDRRAAKQELRDAFMKGFLTSRDPQKFCERMMMLVQTGVIDPMVVIMDFSSWILGDEEEDIWMTKAQLGVMALLFMKVGQRERGMLRWSTMLQLAERYERDVLNKTKISNDESASELQNTEVSASPEERKCNSNKFADSLEQKMDAPITVSQAAIAAEEAF
ncbi:hypothetical protein BJ742DRAFT_812704 [Cladochytrium replicatum]|nr:hypothetical protein BJ742DRAFT_812704 [Cladochytrium replicatum]